MRRVVVVAVLVLLPTVGACRLPPPSDCSPGQIVFQGRCVANGKAPLATDGTRLPEGR